MPRSVQRLRSALLVALLAVAGSVLLPPAAHAVTVPGPAGTTITLDTDEPRPGQQIAISGTGFLPVEGPGSPHIAIKVNDNDVPGFRAGGTNAIPGHTAHALMWFEADPQGRFSGTIEVPSNFTARGPGVDGSHSFRILSGAFSSTGGEVAYPDGGPGTTAPVSFSIPFRVRPRVELGASGFTVFPGGGGVPADTEPVFTPGTTFRRGPAPAANSFASVRLADAAAGDPVEIKLGSTVLTTAAVTQGSRRRVRFAVPATTDLGPTTLTVTVAGVPETHAVRIAEAATASITTPAVRPGGLVGYRYTGHTAVDGKPQKVGLVVDEVVLACVTADATGSGSGVVALPATTTTGGKAFGFATGTSCTGPTGRQDDLPAGRIAPTLDVSETAPTAASSTPVPAGGAATLTGTGFVAGQTVSVALDGTDTGVRIAVGGDGALSGSLPLPSATTAGEHVLTFSSTGATALARLTTTAPVTDPPPVTDPVVVPPAVIAPADATPPATVPPATTTPLTTPTTVRPAPKPAPLASATIKSLKRKGTTLRVNIGSILGRRTTVSVKSAAKVRVSRRSKPKIVTFAATATTRAGVLTIALRKDGRAALRRLEKVTVVVRLAPKGGSVVTERLVLRR